MPETCTVFLLNKEADIQGLTLLKNWWTRNQPVSLAAPTQAEVAAGRVANPRTPAAQAEAQRWADLDKFQKEQANPAFWKAYKGNQGYVTNALKMGYDAANNFAGKPFTPTRSQTAGTAAVQKAWEGKIGSNYGAADAFNLRANDYAKSVDNYAKTRAAQGAGGAVDQATFKGMAGHDIEKETKNRVSDESWGTVKKWAPWIAGGALLLGGGLLGGHMMSGKQPTQQPTGQPPLGGTPDWAKDKSWGRFS